MKRKRTDYNSLENRLTSHFESAIRNQQVLELVGDHLEFAEKLLWIHKGKFYDPTLLPEWTYTQIRKDHYLYRDRIDVQLDIQGQSFRLHALVNSAKWRLPEHTEKLEFPRDERIAAETVGYLPGWAQLQHLLSEIVPARLEMIDVLNKALKCLAELVKRASDQEIIQMYPSIPNIINRPAKRTRGVSEKRRKAILEGEWDLTANPPQPGVPVEFADQFQHALAFLSLEQMKP